jgi:hypothetical protein
MLAVNTRMFALSDSAIRLTPTTVQTVASAGIYVVNYFSIRPSTLRQAGVPTAGAVL